MNKGLLFGAVLSAALGIAGCGPTVYIDETGKQAFSVTCNLGITYCYEQAGQQCPHGYTVTEKLVSGQRKVTTGNSKYNFDDENFSNSVDNVQEIKKSHELLFTCK